MSPFPGDHDANGFKENNQVEEKGLVLDVVKVVLQFFCRVLDSCPVVVTNLRPASYARLHTVTYGIKGISRVS